jgi:GT2 family glycosyltransferase
MVLKNGLKYTIPAFETIKTNYSHKIIIIDHYSDQETKDYLKTLDVILITDPLESTGRAYDINLGIKEAKKLGCDHFLIIDNDILLHSECIDNLVDRFQRGDCILISGHTPQCDYPEHIFHKEIESFDDGEYPLFSCFLTDTNTLEKIGWFDEHIVNLYWEDIDYLARIHLAGERAISYTGAIYYHYASQTLKDSPNQNEIHEDFKKNQDYFFRKWGRDFRETKDIFKTPWNIENKSVKDCNEN